MRLLHTPTLLLLLVLVAPIAALAEDPPAQADPPSGTDQAAAPQPVEEDLPYGAGYEARHRRGQGGEQAGGGRRGEPSRAETKSAARERDRTESRASPTDARPARDTTDRSQAARESRREARGHWGRHGPVRR